MWEILPGGNAIHRDSAGEVDKTLTIHLKKLFAAELEETNGKIDPAN